ncbi:hypothetical protein GCM10020216_025250 [Nonomuraea helvata]
MAANTVCRSSGGRRSEWATRDPDFVAVLPAQGPSFSPGTYDRAGQMSSPAPCLNLTALPR